LSDRALTPGGAVVIGSDYKALAVVRSLGRRGIRVAVLDDGHVLANWSRYVQRTFAWPAAGEAEKVAYLIDLARRNAMRGWAIYPTEDEAAALLARNREALADWYRLTVLVPWETLRWAYDKRLTYRLASDLGVGYPRTFYPQSTQDIRSYRGAYPAILKPAIRAEFNRFTSAKAWPADDLETLVSRYGEACDLIDPSLIMVQEQIPGGGECQLSYAALCRQGEPLASVVARRTRQWPMDFGRASTYVETVVAPDVEEIARRLLSALRFDGIVEVEFKRDPRDGRLKLLDINPRVWGWHSLGAAAGVDFTYLLWNMVSGTSTARLRGRPGVRWVRALTDVPTVIGEMRAGRLSLTSYLASLRGPIEFAVLARDDLLPAVVELPAAAYLAVRRRRVGAREKTVRSAAVPVPSGDGQST
jgi:D-aspartate ligase